MATAPVRFYRIGSDPEFLFIDRNNEIVPAVNVVGSKLKAKSSFIGTDGHAATAELRPSPAHNIKRHLYDIAVALTMTADSLEKRGIAYRLVAPPMYIDEPLGGHIHLSLLIDDPIWREAEECGLTWMGDQVHPAPMKAQPVPHKPRSPAIIDRFAVHCRSAANFAPARFANRLHWLLLPLEYAVQEWNLRMSRNNRYGSLAKEDAVVRIQGSPRPEGHDKSAYVHLEYRTPSSWLAHPWQAYAYLALAKLSAMNMPAIVELSKSMETLPKEFGYGNPGNRQAWKLLDQRLAALFKKEGLLVSRDLRELEQALDYLRDGSMDAMSCVAVEAWRRLL